MKSAYSIFIALIWSFFLVGCGGGGSISSDPGDGGTPEPEVISIVLDTSSNDVSASSPVTLKVTVESSTVGLLGNKVVAFSLSDESFGFFSPESGTVKTDSNGVAEITLNTSTKPGAVTVIASIDSGESTSTGVTMAGDGAVIGGNIIQVLLKDAADNPINNISFDSPGYIYVKYLDPAGNSIPNNLVTFSLNDAELASFFPNSGTTLTNKDGLALIKLIAANKEGAGSVAVKIDDQDPVNINFSSKGDASVSGTSSISALLVDENGKNTSNVSDSSPAYINVALADSSGVGLSNEVITFAFSDSSLGRFEPQSGKVLTDAAGKATIKVRSANVETAATVNISGIGLSTSISFYLAGDGVAVGSNRLSIKLLDASGSDITQVSNAVPATVEATYLDINGTALVGKVAKFSSTLGNLEPSSGSALTDSSGVAKVQLNAGDVAGAGSVLVAVESSTASIGFDTLGDEVIVRPIDTYTITLSIENSAGNEHRNITLTAPGIVNAALLNNGIPVSNEVVNFSLIGEGAINPTSGNALTDANGIAKVTLLTGIVEGAGTAEVSFTLGADQISDTFNYSVAGDAPSGDGENNSLAITLLDLSGNQTSNVSQANPGKVQVFLSDRDGNPLSQKLISFTSTLGDFLPSIGTSLTDSAGSAELLITAGTVEGAATVSANYGASVASLSFVTAGDDIDPVAADPSISFEIYDCNGVAGFDKALKNFELCTITDNITNLRPGILGATIKLEGSNQPLKQVLVSAGTTLGAISPNSATAITNADGKAVLDLYSNGDVGAGEVSLKVKQVTSTKAFEIGRVDISLDISTYIGSGTLPAGGSTVIEVTVKDSSGLIETSQPFTLEFTSQCMAAGSSVIDSPVVTNAGKGFATYRSINCEGTDTVTVSAITGASTVSATADIIISPVQVGAIEFVTASPSELAIKVSGGLSGTGSRSETSLVSFKLLNEVGQAAGSERVCFELSTDVGGMTLTPAPLANDYVNCPNFPKSGDSEYPLDISEPNKYAVAYSDANGDVEVTVRSGTVSTPVKVFAVWQDSADASNPIVANVSDSLTVTTGLADFNSFSLSSTELNLEGWEHDGESASITIRSADHFNNPVPAGTVINFRTEGGNVAASCQTIDKTGACSLDWTSQNPRPFESVTVTCTAPFDGSSTPPCIGSNLASGTDFIIQEPRPGRATITAYAIGEESFVDLNGNGQYDFGEDWTDLTEAFTDHNEDGFYRGASIPAGAVNEEFIDYNSNGSFDDVDGFYTGLLCASSSSANCTQTGVDNSQAQLNVFRNLTLVMSGSTPYGRLVDIDDAGNITPVIEIDLTVNLVDDDSDPVTPEVDLGLSSKTVYLFLSDLNNNTLSNGTTITASTDNGDLSSSTQSYKIGNNSSNKPLLFAFSLSRESTENKKSSGLLSITVTTKYGDPVTFSVNVRDDG
ncbi:invasin [Shewanella sp. Choline-02u-19]|uniref:invasin n=1 Tax=unclassified Shewanella TaxID=196818 RepID=UPI000C32110B|nr:MULTISPECIES: invasin [unclassified Shewanella]PKH59162.1 invasin [Shewanella sp. Bg11-22]PKI27037.1 invasin [Shewanella sp. Choline-02u-19]